MSGTLARIYPGMYQIAKDVVRRANLPSMRPQALWFDGEVWQSGPADGQKFDQRPKCSMIAGTYNAGANASDIVADMLITIGAQ